MPTARTPWRASAAAIVATISPAGWLDALNDLIVAEVAANPATAQWTVSHYDAVNGTLELKKLQAVDAVRILLFGGQVPNAAAIFECVASASHLFCSVAPTANATGPTGDYAAAAPYAVPLVGGIGWASNQTTVGHLTADRVRYWENGSAICVVIHHDDDAASTGYMIAGDVIDDPDGDPVYMALSAGSPSTSTNAVHAVPLKTNALSNDFISGTGATGYPSSRGRFFSGQDIVPSAGSIQALPNTAALRAGASARCQSVATWSGDSTGFVDNLKTTASNKSFLIPIPIISNTTAEFLGHLRQIMVGPRAPLGAILTKDAAPYARAISADPINAADALWLVD